MANGLIRAVLVLGWLSLAISLAFGDTRETTAIATQSTGSAGSVHTDADSLGRFARGQWDLNEAEWARYQSLMHGIRGSVSPATLSPIEVLGIHAQTEVERKDYARRWARLMHEDAARVLAFQAAYDQASRELYPGAQIIDTSLLKGNPAPANSPLEWAQPGDRVLLFLGLDCLAC